MQKSQTHNPKKNWRTIGRFVPEPVERGGCGWIRAHLDILFHLIHHMTGAKHAVIVNYDFY